MVAQTHCLQQWGQTMGLLKKVRGQVRKTLVTPIQNKTMRLCIYLNTFPSDLCGDILPLKRWIIGHNL